VRACFLATTGALTPLVAHHLLRKAAEALRAVREQDLLGKYVLHERLGVGGMAEVFQNSQPTLPLPQEPEPATEPLPVLRRRPR
jgi:hypothetical protein